MPCINKNQSKREGLLYKPDEFQYYFELPNDRPDSIIAVIDSKNMGTDYVANASWICIWGYDLY